VAARSAKGEVGPIQKWQRRLPINAVAMQLVDHPRFGRFALVLLFGLLVGHRLALVGFRPIGGGIDTAGRSTNFGASALGASAFGVSTVLGCSAAAGSSLEAIVSPRDTPACAEADSKTIAATRMNLRM